MTERKISRVKKEVSGVVIRTVDVPHDEECFAWIDVEVDKDDVRRLLVTQRYRQENRLYEGKIFTWKQWTSALTVLNMFSDVIDVTRLMNDSGIEIGRSRPPLD